LFALKVKSDGGAEFNTYGHFMATHSLIRPLEWGLFAGFLLHAVLGIFLVIKNRQARPVQYEVNSVNENSSWVSRLSWLTGIFVGVFLVVHINTFFVQSRFFDSREMIELIKEAFASKLYVAFYVVALVFLAYHLKHGIQSAFQTLGWNVGKFKAPIAALGAIFWLVIPIAFAIIPLYFLLCYH
jgi:succinate dehydrogenase / fumarate reductase cytochrome b subunit